MQIQFSRKRKENANSKIAIHRCIYNTVNRKKQDKTTRKKEK